MKVEILFPEVGNLCGALMNIRYLHQCCPELEFLETDLKSRPAFLEGGVDLVRSLIHIRRCRRIERGRTRW